MMDILGAIGQFAGDMGKDAFMWVAGATISTYIANEIRKSLSAITDGIMNKIKVETNSIEDKDLREAARHIVRYVGNQFPDVSSDEKLRLAIKKLQEITPDILVSDEKVKVLVESAYSEFKRELQNA